MKKFQSLLMLLFLNLYSAIASAEYTGYQAETKRIGTPKSCLLENTKIPDLEHDLTPLDKQWINQQIENLKEIPPLAPLSDAPTHPIEAAELPDTSRHEKREPTQLLVFISFSMPRESLKATAISVKRAGGTLVLRGLVENSLKKTIAKIQSIFGADYFSVLTIDPVAFKTFDIQAVPAVVVTQHSRPESENAHSISFDIVRGDAGLIYVLKKIAVEGEQSALALSYLSALEEKP